MINFVLQKYIDPDYHAKLDRTRAKYKTPLPLQLVGLSHKWLQIGVTPLIKIILIFMDK